MLLERMARKSWEKLERAERALGFSSPEANIFRAQWSAFDTAFKLVYEETINYSSIW